MRACKDCGKPHERANSYCRECTNARARTYYRQRAGKEVQSRLPDETCNFCRDQIRSNTMGRINGLAACEGCVATQKQLVRVFAVDGDAFMQLVDSATVPAEPGDQGIADMIVEPETRMPKREAIRKQTVFPRGVPFPDMQMHYRDFLARYPDVLYKEDEEEVTQIYVKWCQDNGWKPQFSGFQTPILPPRSEDEDKFTEKPLGATLGPPVES